MRGCWSGPELLTWLQQVAPIVPSLHSCNWSGLHFPVPIPPSSTSGFSNIVLLHTLTLFPHDSLLLGGMVVHCRCFSTLQVSPLSLRWWPLVMAVYGLGGKIPWMLTKSWFRLLVVDILLYHSRRLQFVPEVWSLLTPWWRLQLSYLLIFQITDPFRVFQ